MAEDDNTFLHYFTRLGSAFAASRIFHAALELDLFTKLDRPMSAQEKSQLLSLHPRAMPDFVNCLVALKLLERSGSDTDALFSNTTQTAKFLSRTSENYAGGMVYSFATRSYKFWNHLTEALQTGKPQNEAHPRYIGGPLWESTLDTEDKVAKFMNAMVAYNKPAHQAFASRFDFETSKLFLDVGGGSGQLSCEVANVNRQVQCLCLELPNVCETGNENIAFHGLQDRVRMIEGSCWTTNFEKADVIVYSMIVHSYDEEKNQMLMKKGYDALNEGGRLVIIDIFVDNERREALEALVMSMHMLIASESGQSYSVKEVSKWAADVGFRKSETMHLSGASSAVISHK